MQRGKHYIDSKKLIDKTKAYELEEAVALAVETAKSKFDETIELHVKLGIDPRHADQQVRGVVVLPNGTGRSVRVLAIVKADKIGSGYINTTVFKNVFLIGYVSNIYFFVVSVGSVVF